MHHHTNRESVSDIGQHKPPVRPLTVFEHLKEGQRTDDDRLCGVDDGRPGGGRPAATHAAAAQQLLQLLHRFPLPQHAHAHTRRHKGEATETLTRAPDARAGGKPRHTHTHTHHTTHSQHSQHATKNFETT